MFGKLDMKEPRFENDPWWNYDQNRGKTQWELEHPEKFLKGEELEKYLKEQEEEKKKIEAEKAKRRSERSQKTWETRHKDMDKEKQRLLDNAKKYAKEADAKAEEIQAKYVAPKRSRDVAELTIPECFMELFQPSKQWRHIVYYGGRSSGKSTQVALSILIRGAQKKIRVLCTREIQNSMQESVHRLMRDLIAKYAFLNTWSVQKEIIRNDKTGSEIYFKGLHNNEQNIKSFEGVDICWVEEAQSVSSDSIMTLVPTIRKAGSQLIWTFNRLTEEDPVWTEIVEPAEDETAKTYVRKVNSDEIEMVLSDEIKLEREKDREKNPELFEHVWLGEPLTSKTGSVFGKQIAIANEEGRISKVPYDAGTGVYTAWDLGIGDSTAIWFFQCVGKEIHFIEYYEAAGEDLGHYIGVIQNKPYRYIKHFLPHDANAKELQSGMTRVQFFQKQGIWNTQVLRPTNWQPGQDDIDLIARPKFSTAWFDETKCKRGLECLRAFHYDYDKKNNNLKNKPCHDWSSHGSDAFIYAMCAPVQTGSERIKVSRSKKSDTHKILF